MRNEKFFTKSDNFLEIIKAHLPEVIPSSLELIKTGWTNFVICASTKEDSYFFRFPRNSFFSRMMLKDHAFCTFAKDKVSFQLPDLKIFYDKDRPFSMHKKIKGWSLTDRFKFLSRQAITNLAYDIAQFIHELEQIDPQTLPQTCNMYVSKFLDKLPSVEYNAYDLHKHDKLRQLEQHPQVVHGDLNPGNILLDENDRMVAIIDFAFAGISNNYVDLSRIIGRTDVAFEKPMLEAYKTIVNNAVDVDCMREIAQMWNYVDHQYILYMKEKHPEIQLPD